MKLRLICMFINFVIVFNIYASDSINVNQSIIELKIKPSQTDSRIKKWNEEHYILFKPDTNIQKLVVFFDGSKGIPGSYKRLLNTVCEEGNAVINLRYPNSWLTFDVCQGKKDVYSFDNYRYEALDGKNRSQYIDIDTIECVKNRLEKTIIYLADKDTNKLWKNFVNGKKILWEKIILSGFSQGAGTALSLAKLVPVKKVILFAGPVDSNNITKKTAPWVKDSSFANKKIKIYGFMSENDWYYNYIKNCWYSVGMKHFDIIDEKIVNLKSNFIISKKKLNDGHVGTVLDDSEFCYKKVWKYLFK